MDHCFPLVLQAWLDGDPANVKREVLVEALKCVNQGGLAKEIGNEEQCESQSLHP